MTFIAQSWTSVYGEKRHSRQRKQFDQIKDPDKLSANMLMGRRGIHMIQYDMAKDVRWK